MKPYISLKVYRWYSNDKYQLYIFKKSKVELAYHVIINIEKEKNIYENEKYFAQ